MTEHFANTLLRDGKADPCDQASRADPSPALESCTAAAKGGAGRVHQPLSLAAVLHHVLLLDMCDGHADEPALRRLNRVLDTALDACLELDAARQQLQGAIATQRELEIVLEMLAARVEVGQASPVEHRKVDARLCSARDMVTRTVSEWNRIGRRFTQITRLLPVQLTTGFDPLQPVLPDEMDRLAQASLSTSADVQFSLNQRAQAWAARRADPARPSGFGPGGFEAWLSSLEDVRAQAATEFACAREAYLQAVMNFDREHACLVRARSLRRTAEAGFRLNARSATEYADAIAEESRRNHAMLTCLAQRRVSHYHLYALAGLLPRQFELVAPAVGF